MHFRGYVHISFKINMLPLQKMWTRFSPH